MTERDNNSERSLNVSAAPSSSQVIQVETLGKQGMIVMLVMFVVIVLLGILVGYSSGVGEARAENTASQVRQLNARVEVLQWEFDKASAQLINKGLITPPE